MPYQMLEEDDENSGLIESDQRGQNYSVRQAEKLVWRRTCHKPGMALGSKRKNPTTAPKTAVNTGKEIMLSVREDDIGRCIVQEVK